MRSGLAAYRNEQWRQFTAARCTRRLVMWFGTAALPLADTTEIGELAMFI